MHSFHGSILDVRYWRKQRSSKEIKAMMHKLVNLQDSGETVGKKGKRRLPSRLSGSRRTRGSRSARSEDGDADGEEEEETGGATEGESELDTDSERPKTVSRSQTAQEREGGKSRVGSAIKGGGGSVNPGPSPSPSRQGRPFAGVQGLGKGGLQSRRGKKPSRKVKLDLSSNGLVGWWAFEEGYEGLGKGANRVADLTDKRFKTAIVKNVFPLSATPIHVNPTAIAATDKVKEPTPVFRLTQATRPGTRNSRGRSSSSASAGLVSQEGVDVSSRDRMSSSAASVVAGALGGVVVDGIELMKGGDALEADTVTELNEEAQGGRDEMQLFNNDGVGEGEGEDGDVDDDERDDHDDHDEKAAGDGNGDDNDVKKVRDDDWPVDAKPSVSSSVNQTVQSVIATSIRTRIDRGWTWLDTAFMFTPEERQQRDTERSRRYAQDAAPAAKAVSGLNQAPPGAFKPKQGGAAPGEGGEEDDGAIVPVPSYRMRNLCSFELRRFRLAQAGRVLQRETDCPLGNNSPTHRVFRMYHTSVIHLLIHKSVLSNKSSALLSMLSSHILAMGCAYPLFNFF